MTDIAIEVEHLSRHHRTCELRQRHSVSRKALIGRVEPSSGTTSKRLIALRRIVRHVVYRYGRTFLFVLLLCLLLFHRTQAQETVTWSEPVALTNPDGRAGAPAIIADASGTVHMMWSQTLSSNPPPAEGDTLFYARWNAEQGWSQPVDVLVSPTGGAEMPDLAMTPDGILHAVWGTGGVTSKLMYAHAPACCAADPREWSQPMDLGGPVNLTTSLVADERGRLHAAFASLETNNIVYRRSDDGGLTWPRSFEIPGGAVGADEVVSYSRLAVDKRGRVHAVWSVGPWPGRRVMYARLPAGEENWEEPQEIDTYLGEAYSEGYGPIFIDVEAVGEDQIHLIWDGAPTVERHHVWSPDGGTSWSQPAILIPELTKVGRSGWNDMVGDRAGTLHAVALIQPWYAQWAGGKWSGSTAIGQSQHAEWMRIALGLGNRLHVAWLDVISNQQSSVWYVQGRTSAPAVTARAMPPAISSPVPTSTPTAFRSAEGTRGVGGVATPSALARSVPEPKRLDSPATAIIIGVAPALILVGIVIVARARRVRRTGQPHD